MSRILKAPLDKAAGGLGLCSTTDGKPAGYSGTSDPTYQAVLAAIQSAAKNLNAYERPGFKPSPDYLREMIRYGVLPAGFDPAKDPFDPYDIDRRYFEQQYEQVLRPITTSGTK
jgi:hypothetical protein